MSLVFRKRVGTFLNIGVFVWPNLDFWNQGRDRKLGPGPGGQKIQKKFFFAFFCELSHSQQEKRIKILRIFFYPL